MSQHRQMQGLQGLDSHAWEELCFGAVNDKVWAPLKSPGLHLHLQTVHSHFHHQENPLYEYSHFASFVGFVERILCRTASSLTILDHFLWKM